MLRPMILLAFNAAIFHKFASGAYLEYDIVHRCLATRGTARCRISRFFSAVLILFNLQ
jgi:hypothetical protein